MVKAGLRRDRLLHCSQRIGRCQYDQDGGFMETADFAATVRAALIEELEELHKEVRSVADALSDEQLWRRPLEPSNSVGHLVLHLTGNLNHFVGAQLGHTGYVREREREFTESHPPARAVLLD